MVEQILYDGSKELVQNETDSEKYVLSSENKVCIHHSSSTIHYFALL